MECRKISGIGLVRRLKIHIDYTSTISKGDGRAVRPFTFELIVNAGDTVFTLQRNVFRLPDGTANDG